MPRKAWSPKKCSLANLRLSTELPNSLKLWRKFVNLNKQFPNAMSLLYGYAHQMLKAGLKASTVRGRVEEVSNAGIPITEEAFERQIRKYQLAALKKSLLSKQNAVGVKHKIPWSLSVQKVPLDYPDPNYVVWWYVLLATGMRPANLWHAEVCLTPDGVKVDCLQGTKSNPKRTRRPRLYKFLWSQEPDAAIKSFMTEHKMLPRIGEKSNIAALINSWLRRHTTDQSLALTSCCPRARMDQILRKLVSEGQMESAEYEWLMDHTVKTSNESYYGQL